MATTTARSATATVIVGPLALERRPSADETGRDVDGEADRCVDLDDRGLLVLLVNVSLDCASR